MRTVHMGLNTEPRFDLPERFESIPEENKKHIQNEIKYATNLRDEINKIMEEDGECRLSWSCEGRTRHEMHSQQWKEMMPEYEFDIGYNYHCVLKKREE
jgi:hypothetical protein